MNEVDQIRARIEQRQGIDLSEVNNNQLREMIKAQGEAFRDNAPTTAADAAAMMIQGVRDERWRVLLGEDAHSLDRLVRETPEEAYEESFYPKAARRSELGSG